MNKKLLGGSVSIYVTLFVLLIIAIGIAVFVVNTNSETRTTETLVSETLDRINEQVETPDEPVDPIIPDQGEMPENTAMCGFEIESVAPGDIVEFPLRVEAIYTHQIAESQGCYWALFEGEAGVVEVVDGEDNSVGIGVLSAQSDYTVRETPVTFVAEVVLSAEPVTNTARLVIGSNNQSDGEGRIDRIEIPVALAR